MSSDEDTTKCCCFRRKKTGERKPLLTSEQSNGDGSSTAPANSSKKVPSKTQIVEFKRFEITELDRIFDNFKSSINPFVVNRKEMENAEEKFIKAVKSIENINPKASFREHALVLKTKLAENGIFIKIKYGVVSVVGEIGKVFNVVSTTKSAIETIISAGKSLTAMAPSVISASDQGVERCASTDVMAILKREFTGLRDGAKIPRLKNAFTENTEKIKKAPQMVREFCDEAKKVLDDLFNVFADEEEQERIKEESEADKSSGAAMAGKEKGEKTLMNKGTGAEAKKQNEEKKSVDKKTGTEAGKDTEKTEDDSAVDRVSGAEAGKESGEKKVANKETGTEAKKDGEVNEQTAGKETKPKDGEKNGKGKFHKKIKIELIGLDDIDRLFGDFTSAINPLVSTREKLEKAKESFRKCVEVITNFDVEKCFKEYLKDLKEEAKKGHVHIYIDFKDGEIKIESVQGVPAPKPYRDAVKMLEDVKTSAKEIVNLEPNVQEAISAVIEHVSKIQPQSDIKKLLKLKEFPKLPGKVKTFNNNRKKVQEAPSIVIELVSEVKNLLEDIVDVFTGTEKEKEKEETDKDKDKKEDKVEKKVEDKEKTKVEEQDEDKDKVEAEKDQKEDKVERKVKMEDNVEDKEKAESVEQDEEKVEENVQVDEKDKKVEDKVETENEEDKVENKVEDNVDKEKAESVEQDEEKVEENVQVEEKDKKVEDKVETENEEDKVENKVEDNVDKEKAKVEEQDEEKVEENVQKEEK